MKRCGKLNGACVHQDKDSCDGCALMETWLKYKDKSIVLEAKYIKEQQKSIDNIKIHISCYAC